MIPQWICWPLIPLTIGSFALTGCGNNLDQGDPPEPITVSSPAPETTTESDLTDITDGVTGQVGFRHGMDCTTADDCTLNFTVQSLEELGTCDDDVWGSAPNGTKLIKATVLIDTTKPVSDYDPGTFTIWTDWSALTADGLNQVLPASNWCSSLDHTKNWLGALKPGDAELRVHYMDVPDGSTAIRLTETLTGARWEFDLETSLEKTSVLTIPEQPPSQTKEPVSIPSTDNYMAPAPAPVPPPTTPAPAQPPVMGFTGAPGVDPIRPLDKIISHCGDPMMYETGTTFFTDGTTGWTETCSHQMLNQ